MAQVYKDIIRLTIDLKVGVKEVIAPIKQADNLSRVLRCQLVNNGKPVNLKGSQLLLYVVKTDYKQCVINGVINEGKTGIVDFELTEQSLILAEEIQCEIVKIDEGDVLLSFPIFKIGIDGALYDNELVESTNEFSALTALISNVASWESRFVGECERIEKEFDGKIGDVNAQLFQKADKSQIGSPLVASDTSEMTDTTKIYVNTTDGNWYSFNGKAWVSGGLYNSQGIGDFSVTPEMTTFVEHTDIFNMDNCEIGGLNSVGTINATQTGMKTSALIPVKKANNYFIPGFIKYLCYYNINGTSLSSTYPRQSDIRDKTITIPENACFIKVTWITNSENENYRDDSSVKVLNTNEINFIPKIKDKSFSKSTIIEDVIDRNDFDDNVYLEYLKDYKILMIYMKTAKNYYLGYNFRYMKAEYNASNTSSNYDVWRLRDVKIYIKNSDDTFTKVNDASLIHSASEWECAIKEVGASDFVGGSTHGDELLDNIVFMLDGVAYTDVTQISKQKCKELRIIRTSRLYRADANSETKIATHYVDYLFKGNEIVIDQKVNWLVDTTCGISYLAMLGAKRLDNGVQITSSALKDGEGVIYDVSQDNYDNGACTPLKKCKKAFLWNNSNSGFKTSMSVEILDSNNFPNANFKFDNRPDYNKFYFDHCGNNFAVKNGDIWCNKAKYKIDFIGFF